MAKMKQTWLSNDGDEHDTERDADIRNLILISDKEIDAWLASKDDMSPKRKIEYARVLKLWERERIEREFDSMVASTESQRTPVMPPPLEYTESADAVELPTPQDGDAEFGGAVVLKV